MSTSVRILDFNGYFEGPTGKGGVTLWINAPRQTEGETDFYCEIGGSLFQRPMKIYGEDAEQAKDLAYSVMRKQLKGKRLFDLAGVLVDLPGLGD